MSDSLRRDNPALKNFIRGSGFTLLRYIIYFVLIYAVLMLVYQKNIFDSLEDFYFGDAPTDTIKAMAICSLSFIFLAFLICIVTVLKEQNYFSTALFMRIIVFILNILPIAIFQHSLLKLFGYIPIYVFLVYMILQIVYEFIIRSRIRIHIFENIRMVNNFYIIITETLLFMLAVYITVKLMPDYYINNIEMKRNFDIMFGVISYFVYIVLFNSITFFTVEYGISIFKEEYKKNYSRYYFKYKNSIFKRLLFIINNAAAILLIKIKKNLVWLISFIITVEAIFENQNSVGFRLISSYIYNEPSRIMINVMYIFIFMFIINFVIDLLIFLLTRHEDESARKPAAVQGTLIKGTANLLITDKNKKGIIAVVSGFLFVYILLVGFNCNEYPMLGYYDFSQNMTRTFKDFMAPQSISIGTENCPLSVCEPYLDEVLCKKINGKFFNAYNIIQIRLEDNQGEINTITPFYDRSNRGYYFISKGKNTEQQSIQPNLKIISIDYSKKYRIPVILDIMTGLRLPADTSAAVFGEKPVLLLLPFYLIYFMTIVLVTALLTLLVYYFLIKKEFSGNISNSSNPVGRIVKKLSNEVLLFFNSITLILFFILVNIVINRILSLTGRNIAWVNSPFLLNLFIYLLVQVIINWIFSDSYSYELKAIIQKLLKTDEFNYYNLIGINKNIKLYINIFNTKYGFNLLIKQFIQNLLFVINMNWFISYAFNAWSALGNSDTIGITYAVSFENIFSKTLLNDHGYPFDTAYKFILLFLYGGLFFVYYWLQTRAGKEE
jgi:hypothetical protein